MAGPYYEVRSAGPPGWRFMPPVTKGTLVLTAAGYLACLVVRPLSEVLVAIPAAIVPGLQLWRLVTYPVAVIGILSVLIDMLLLWSFGSELERSWGSRRYAGFLLACTAVAGVLGTGGTALLLPEAKGAVTAAGPAPLITAAIVAWMRLGPGLPVSFFGILPMTRQIFAILALVIVVFGQLDATRFTLVTAGSLLFLLGGLPVAWAYTRRAGFGGPGAFRRFGLGRWLGRRRLHVVRGERIPPWN